jgi:hypothetical protein
MGSITDPFPICTAASSFTDVIRLTSAFAPASSVRSSNAMNAGPVHRNKRSSCERDGGRHGTLGMLARFEAGERIEGRRNHRGRAPDSLRNFQLFAKLGQCLTHLPMPVLRFLSQTLQAFEQPEAEHANAIDGGSFLDLLFNLAQPLHRVGGRRTETGRRLHCRG